MWHFAGLSVGALVCVGFGYWLHYRFGAAVAKDAAVIKSLGSKL